MINNYLESVKSSSKNKIIPFNSMFCHFCCNFVEIDGCILLFNVAPENILVLLQRI